MRNENTKFARGMVGLVCMTLTTVVAALMLACSASMQPGNSETICPPSFTYAVPSSGSRVEVRLGVMHAVFGSGTDASDRDNQALAAASTQGFYDLLVAKGFTVSGPHESLDAMTFPEKRNVSLVVYPEFNIQWTVEEFARDVSGGGLFRSAHSRARFRVSAHGFVTITAIEPLSQQRMWTKRVTVETTPIETAVVERTREGANNASQNAYNRTVEAVYAQLIGELDRYVNAEEFQGLARDVEQLRAHTNFGGH